MWNVLLLTTLLTLSLGNVWLEAVELDHNGKGLLVDVGREEFNAAFSKCPVVQYTRNGNVHSIYKRVSAVPDGFDAYGLFTQTWRSVINMLHEDFEIYSNYADLWANQNEWQFCNYDDPDVGYPRDCGKHDKVDGKWFSLPGGKQNAPGLTNGASFEIHQSCNCPVTNSHSNFKDAVCLSHDGKDITKFGRDKFNAAFRKCPIVQYTRNGEVHSIYRRVSQIPDNLDAYDIFTSTWTESDNVLHEDFDIYSNYEDLTANQNEWSFCNFDDFDVGYPRDCGRDGNTKYMWFSFPGGKHDSRDLNKGAGFAIHQSCNCPLIKLPGTSVLERNRFITNVKVYANYQVSFTIRPIGVLSGWTNVLHITAWNQKIQKMGGRIPSVFFHSESTKLHVSTGCNGWYNTYLDPPDSLPLGKDTQVTIRVYDDVFTVHYDDREVGRRACANHFEPLYGQLATVYLSNPW